jgi:hypothetical protein
VRAIVPGKRDPIFPTPKLARDSYLMSVHEMTPEAVSGVVQVLLEGWPGQLPPHLHRGLLQVYSTLQVDGTRVTLGAAPAQKDRDWTRAHMLAVHPDYSGKLRVLLGNLSRGVEPEVAYKNAFAMTAEEIERAVDRYMETGQYGTIPAPSRPVNPRRELIGKPMEENAAKLAQADLLFAHGQPGAREAYQALNLQEGLGLIDRKQELLKDATSARALYEYARMVPALDAKRAALTKAAAANKRWAEPWKMLASVETHPAQKLSALRKVVELEPQVAANWIALAQLQEEAKQYAEAAKSWAIAERASVDPTERDRVRQNRLAGETKRLEAQIAAREEVRRKAEAEITALRERALMEIRKAEARANEGKPIIDPKGLDEYREGPNTKRVSGVLVRVDCQGQTARLFVASGKQTVRLFVPDPGQVELAGGGQMAFPCGSQPAGRKVGIDYTPREDKAQGTTGDAVRIEFSK